MIELLDPNERCVCGHRSRSHRPSAVTPFGRGCCLPGECACRRMTIPGVPEPEPLYPMIRGSRFTLLVHYGRPSRDGGEYERPRLIAGLPTVTPDTAWLVGHTLVDHDDRRRPAYTYVDWAGGEAHRLYEDAIYIGGCGCGGGLHGFRDALVVAEMTPILAWANESTARGDWCEMVPIRPAADLAAVS